MSIVVSIAELPAAMSGQIGWCYLLSVSSTSQARALAVSPKWSSDGRLLEIAVGRGAAANLAIHPSVALVFPPVVANGMSLIVDGVAVVAAGDQGATVLVEPTTAVMHRSALAT